VVTPLLVFSKLDVADVVDDVLHAGDDHFVHVRGVLDAAVGVVRLLDELV
jgi:hypothetical protein